MLYATVNRVFYFILRVKQDFLVLQVRKEKKERMRIYLMLLDHRDLEEVGVIQVSSG